MSISLFAKEFHKYDSPPLYQQIPQGLKRMVMAAIKEKAQELDQRYRQIDQMIDQTGPGELDERNRLLDIRNVLLREYITKVILPWASNRSFQAFFEQLRREQPRLWFEIEADNYTMPLLGLNLLELMGRDTDIQADIVNAGARKLEF